MKKLVGFLVLLVGTLQLASANWMFGNFQLMMEVSKNKDKILTGLAKKEFIVTRSMIIDALEQTVEIIKMQRNITTFEGFNTEYDDIHCGFQLAALANGLQLGELWALEVVDSYAKFQSGFARGNIRNPGHFRQCIEIYQEMDDPLAGGFFQGKHCTIAMRGIVEGEWEWPIPIITPPPIIDIGGALPGPLFLDYGMCLPGVCNVTFVEIFARLIGLYLGLEPAPFFLNNHETLCHHTNLPPLGWFEFGALILIGLGFAGMALATTIDMVATKLQVRPNTISIAMSAYTNGRRLFSMRKNKNHIQCLYGLRALALIWLIYGYRHFLSLVLPLINPLDFVLDFATGYFSPWVTSFTFGLDAILLLNGVIIAFAFCKKMEKDGRVSIFKMYLHRYLKVTPYVGVLIYLLLTLTPYSSDGPYYKFFTEAQVPACQEYWWSAILHVQNYVNPESICILHTFLLSIDMQLFWASPLLLFPLFFWGPGFTVIVMVLAGLTVACAFTVSWYNGYRAFFISMALDMDKVFGYLRQIFFATHVRMGAWLIGIFVGYVLWKLKDKKSPINKLLETGLWIASISGIFAVVYWIYPFQQALVEEGSGIEWIRGDEVQNALYIGFSRYIFSLCLGWIIYGCYTGSGSVLNWFLSFSFWMPIARMGLAIYLVSLSAQMVVIASQKTPLVFDRTENWHAFNGDLILVLIFSSLVYLMLEAPLMVVEKHIYDLITPPPPVMKPTALPTGIGFTLPSDEPPPAPKIPPKRSWY